MAQPTLIVETYSIKTMATLMRQHPAATTIVPKAVASELADAKGAMALPHALSWDLPPVGVMWRRQALEDDVVVSLVAALGKLRWADG
ncbi:hypothetical protein D3C72_2382110 [compost metagenome]